MGNGEVDAIIQAMRDLLLVLQIVISFLLIGAISIQTKGGGLTRSLGTQGSFTRRGLEKLVFRFTFVLSFLFILIAILQLVV